MKRYNSDELAAYAKQFALDKYDSADKIYDKFKANLNQRMKRAQPTIPLPEGKSINHILFPSPQGLQRDPAKREDFLIPRKLPTARFVDENTQQNAENNDNKLIGYIFSPGGGM